MATTDELLLPFAQSIHAKVKALKELESKLTPNEKARLLEAISDDIKKCSNFITPKVSRRALDHPKAKGIELSSKNWHDQPQFDPGRTTFQFEHYVPVSAIRSACREGCSEEAIFEILKNNLSVVWILKTEDKELTERGYKSCRRSIPEEAAKAYFEAGIEIVPPNGLSNEEAK